MKKVILIAILVGLLLGTIFACLTSHYFTDEELSERKVGVKEW